MIYKASYKILSGKNSIRNAQNIKISQLTNNSRSFDFDLIGNSTSIIEGSVISCDLSLGDLITSKTKSISELILSKKHNDIHFIGVVESVTPKLGTNIIKIKCKDFMSIFSRNDIKHSFSEKSISLKDLINKIVKDRIYTEDGVEYNIEFEKIVNIDLEIKNLTLNNMTTKEVFDYIKKEFGFHVNILGTTIIVGYQVRDITLSKVNSYNFSDSNLEDCNHIIDYANLTYQESITETVNYRAKVITTNGDINYYHVQNGNTVSKIKGNNIDISKGSSRDFLFYGDYVESEIYNLLEDNIAEVTRVGFTDTSSLKAIGHNRNRAGNISVIKVFDIINLKNVGSFKTIEGDPFGKYNEAYVINKTTYKYDFDTGFTLDIGLGFLLPISSSNLGNDTPSLKKYQAITKAGLITIDSSGNKEIINKDVAETQTQKPFVKKKVIPRTRIGLSQDQINDNNIKTLIVKNVKNEMLKYIKNCLKREQLVKELDNLHQGIVELNESETSFFESTKELEFVPTSIDYNLVEDATYYKQVQNYIVSKNGLSLKMSNSNIEYNRKIDEIIAISDILVANTLNNYTREEVDTAREDPIFINHRFLLLYDKPNTKYSIRLIYNR